jgi:hypothetical protein
VIGVLDHFRPLLIGQDPSRIEHRPPARR